MFSMPPRKIPAGKIRSATIAFHMLHCLPAPHVTHLRRNLYVVVLRAILCSKKKHHVNYDALKNQTLYPCRRSPQIFPEE